MQRIARVSLFWIVAASLAGCTAYSPITGPLEVIDRVGQARGGVQAWHTAKTLRDFTAEAVDLSQFDSVYVQPFIVPRDEDRANEVVDAFNRSAQDALADLFADASMPHRVCKQGCGEQPLRISFTEDSYGENVVNRLSLGDKLRGVMQFQNMQSGEVLQSLRLENQDDYLSIISLVRAAVVQSASLYLGQQGRSEEETRRIAAKMSEPLELSTNDRELLTAG